MPNWKQILEEVQTDSKVSVHDRVRRKYLKQFAKQTGRNVIVYYSGWLQKGDIQQHGFSGFALNDGDKNGFMVCVHRLDKAKGLDLVLHTPGGSIGATESLVHYLREMFGTNIRAFVPQIAMSAGTMIACACKEIWMGKHSSLGPIDPQVGGKPAHGVLEEFLTAKREIEENPARIPVWQPILANYSPAFIGECDKAMRWTRDMVKQWLVTGMFSGDPAGEGKAIAIVTELGDHIMTCSHDRHIAPSRAQELGLCIRLLEDDDRIQDLVLSIHHAYIQTLSATAAYKVIENQLGVAFIQQLQAVMLPQGN
jgi:hypothetical protein